MPLRGTPRRDSSLFKIRACQEIRRGGLVRRRAIEKYNLRGKLCSAGGLVSNSSAVQAEGFIPPLTQF